MENPKGEADRSVFKSRPKIILNVGDEDEMEIEGYRFSMLKSSITWIFFVLTVGLLRLVFHWWPQLMLYAMNQPCSLHQAEKVLITETYGERSYKRYHVKDIQTISSSSEKEKSPNPNAMVVDGHKYKLGIPTCDGKFQDVDKIKYFYCKKLRYLWDEQSGSFIKLQGFEKGKASFLHEHKGLSADEQARRLLIFGPNDINVEVMSIPKLLFLEVLNPFYVFQVFSVTLWYNDYYYYYASAIIIMSVVGVASTVYQTRQNQNRLRSTVKFSDIVTVSRGSGNFESIPTEQLVPGDLIVIPAHGCQMNCDAVLLSGNCIVNESMLTGESVPVTKTPIQDIQDMKYNIKEHSRHTLFCGTRILQTRYYGQEHVYAVVIRTGFLTAKGNLVRSIMYPPPVDHKFETDSYKFIGFMGCIASVGFLGSIWWKVDYGEPVRAIIVQSLDLITIVIPPALPAAMAAGRIYALQRLKNKGIYCISPRTLTITGSIDCVCFDKTGTLTEEGLDLWGIVPVANQIFQEAVRDTDGKVAKIDLSIETGMATCHSLTILEDTLVGDPLDLKMFDWTGWTLEEPEIADSEKFDNIIPAVVRSPSNSARGKKEVGIIRQFPFSSSLQRMSVITRTLGAEEFELYVKGSPEVISSMSLPSSVPENFATILSTYTQQGYRVIAIAHRQLNLTYTKAQRAQREELEKDLTFLGLIVLDNRLKPESATEIAVLKNANIRTIMVTGDNIQTSAAVAIECGIVRSEDTLFLIDGVEQADSSLSISVTRLNTNSIGIESDEEAESKLNTRHKIINMESLNSSYHLAVTGKAFEFIKTHRRDLLEKLLVRGTVFARMSPDQKQQLVEMLQSIGYFVGMCGDGANDCGALKASHAGISLSDAEASVASPFTYNQNNISCVSNLIREGRTALVTSFGIFKYMTICSFTQFISVCILYIVSANVSDPQFLYIDLFITSNFALFFGYTEPYPGPLVHKPPSASLVSRAPIVSIVLHMFNTLGFQALGFWIIQQQPWFVAFEATDDERIVKGYENTAVFTISIFQYISMAVIFSQGRPYRRAIFTNYRFMASLIIMTAFTFYLVLKPFPWLNDLFQMDIPPSWSFQMGFLGIALANLIIAVFIEEVIVHWLIETKLKAGDGQQGKQKYELINKKLNAFDISQVDDEFIEKPI